MTATEQLIAKQVSDVFPASVDDLPLADAARRGLIAPLRCLRVPPAAAINSVPIVGGDFEERALAAALDHSALNQAAASLYRERFGTTPGIVYAAGVEHAYNLAQEFRAAGIKAEAVSGKTPLAQARRDARRLRARRDQRPHQRAAPRRGLELAARDGLLAPRPDRVAARLPAAHRPDHAHALAQGGRDRRRLRHEGVDAQRPRRLAPLAARRRLLPRGRPGHAGAAPAPAAAGAAAALARSRGSCPSPPTSRAGSRVIQREWQRVDPKFLDDDEQRFWGTIAGRQIRFDQRAEFARKFTEGHAGKGALETFLAVCAAENPNRRLRMTALADRVATPVERADFDDLVTLVSQAPPWEKDRSAGVRILLRAIGEGKANAPDQILARWTWKLARATRKVQDRRASAEFPEAKRLLGAVANSRGHRHEDNVAKLVQVATRAAARGRRRAARVGRRLHAAGEHAARPGARGARPDPGDRERAGGEPACAEGARPQVTPAGARSAGRRRRPALAGAGGRRGRRRSGGTGSARDRPGKWRRGRRRDARRSSGRERGVGRRLKPDAARRPARRLPLARSAAAGGSPLSRSRRNCVISAASDSPVGRSSSSSISSSIVSARRSSSST